MAQGALGKLKLADKPLILLNDRLRVRMPAQAQLSARPVNIMAAEESTEEECRVVLDAGPERMVVLATELFATAGEDYESQVRKMVDGWPMNGAAIEHGHDGKIFISPAEFDLTQKAIPVLFLFLTQGVDASIQLVQIFVNPTAGADIPGCVAQARSIAETIVPGGKKLDLGGHPKQIGPYSADLPKGYILIPQRGPDFWVYRLQKVVPLGSASAHLGMYLGAHPSFHHDHEEGKVQVTKITRPLFGTNVEWDEWITGKWTHHEIISQPSAFPNMYHIFLTASTTEDIEQLHAIAGSLRKK